MHMSWCTRSNTAMLLCACCIVFVGKQAVYISGYAGKPINHVSALSFSEVLRHQIKWPLHRWRCNPVGSFHWTNFASLIVHAAPPKNSPSRQQCYNTLLEQSAESFLAWKNLLRTGSARAESEQPAWWVNVHSDLAKLPPRHGIESES